MGLVVLEVELRNGCWDRERLSATANTQRRKSGVETAGGCGMRRENMVQGRLSGDYLKSGIKIG